MGETIKFQAHSVTDTHTDEPTIHYSTSSSGVSSYKNVGGKESLTSSGVTRATSRAKDAGVMIGGLSIHPDEVEDFLREIEGEQAEAEDEAEQADDEVAESTAFEESANIVLNDLDRGDIANAVNLAVKGELNEDNIARAVSSLGFGDRDSAIEVGNNVIDSLTKSFEKLAQAEGMDKHTAWHAMMDWNRTEAGKAVQDWVATGGVDAERLKNAISEGLNAYGKPENEALVSVLKEDGYEVKRSPSGGLIIKGNGVADWVSWREFRNAYKQ